MDAYSPSFGAIFMVLLILFGSFFLLNLTLSVIWSSFEESQEQEKAKKEYLFRKKFNLDSEPLLTEETKQGANVLAALRFFGAPVKVPGKFLNDVPVVADDEAAPRSPVAKAAFMLSLPPIAAAAASLTSRSSQRQLSPGAAGLSPASRAGSHRSGATTARRVLPSMPSSFRVPLFSQRSTDQFDVNQLTEADIAERLQAHLSRRSSLGLVDGHHSPGAAALWSPANSEALRSEALDTHVPAVIPEADGDEDPSEGSASISSEPPPPSLLKDGQLADLKEDSIELPIPTRSQRIRARLELFQRHVHDAVTSNVFSSFVGLLIVLNTLVLSYDHYPMPDTESSNLEVINFVLTCMFTLDMTLKLIGMGFSEYFR